jgi:hypothetical protein
LDCKNIEKTGEMVGLTGQPNSNIKFNFTSYPISFVEDGVNVWKKQSGQLFNHSFNDMVVESLVSWPIVCEKLPDGVNHPQWALDDLQKYGGF